MITDKDSSTSRTAQHTRRTLLTRIGASAAFVGVLAVAGCTPSSSETAATTTLSRTGPHAEPARRRHVQRGGQLLHQRPGAACNPCRSRTSTA